MLNFTRPVYTDLDHRIGRLAQLVRAPALQAGCRGFESLTAHHSSKKRALFVLLININEFKQLTDELGNDVAGEALRLFGAVLSNQVRAGDLAARLDGEEYIFLLPGTAERSSYLCRMHLRGVDPGRPEKILTASLGLAAIQEQTLSFENLTARTDRAL